MQLKDTKSENAARLHLYLLISKPKSDNLQKSASQIFNRYPATIRAIHRGKLRTESRIYGPWCSIAECGELRELIVMTPFESSADYRRRFKVSPRNRRPEMSLRDICSRAETELSDMGIESTSAHRRVTNNKNTLEEMMSSSARNTGTRLLSFRRTS
jgi:hypothetical protein